MNDQETRIKRAAEALRRREHEGGDMRWETLARIALEAADAPPTPPKPKWPTDDTMERLSQAFNGSTTEWDNLTRRIVARILRTHDPIIRTALEARRAERCRSVGRTGYTNEFERIAMARVFKAIDEAESDD